MSWPYVFPPSDCIMYEEFDFTKKSTRPKPMFQCSRVHKGERCQKPALWQPVLNLYVHPRHDPATSVMPLPLCDECKSRTVLRDVLGDEGWSQITGELAKAGKVLPDRRLTVLTWKRITFELKPPEQ